MKQCRRGYTHNIVKLLLLLLLPDCRMTWICTTWGDCRHWKLMRQQVALVMRRRRFWWREFSSTSTIQTMWILVPTLTLVFLLCHQEVPQVLRISSSSSSSVEKMREKKIHCKILHTNTKFLNKTLEINRITKTSFLKFLIINNFGFLLELRFTRIIIKILSFFTKHVNFLSMQASFVLLLVGLSKTCNFVEQKTVCYDPLNLLVVKIWYHVTKVYYCKQTTFLLHTRFLYQLVHRIKCAIVPKLNLSMILFTIHQSIKGGNLHIIPPLVYKLASITWKDELGSLQHWKT